MFHFTANGFNFGAQHPAIEEMLIRGAQTGDEADRFAIQEEIARFLHAEELAIPLFGENMVWPLSSKAGSLGGWHWQHRLAGRLGGAHHTASSPNPGQQKQGKFERSPGPLTGASLLHGHYCMATGMGPMGRPQDELTCLW